MGSPSSSTPSGFNDFRFVDGAGCQGSRSASDSPSDRAFRFTVPGDQRLTATLSNGADGGTAHAATLNVVAGLAQCGTNGSPAGPETTGLTCVASAAGPGPLTAGWANRTGATMDVYVIVDGEDATAAGPFVLRATVGPIGVTPLPPGETCATATLIPGFGTYQGSTSGLADDYWNGTMGPPTCAFGDDGAHAPDGVYRLDVPAQRAYSVSVQSTWRSLISVVRAPASTCGVPTDAGTTGALCVDSASWSLGAASVGVFNGGPTPQSYFLIINGEETDDHGAFVMTVEAD